MRMGKGWQPCCKAVRDRKRLPLSFPLPPYPVFSASSQEPEGQQERGLQPYALGPFDGDKCREMTNRRACWSEVVGKRDANGHFESFLSMLGVPLNDKKHTLGLLFL